MDDRLKLLFKIQSEMDSIESEMKELDFVLAKESSFSVNIIVAKRYVELGKRFKKLKQEIVEIGYKPKPFSGHLLTTLVGELQDNIDGKDYLHDKIMELSDSIQCLKITGA